MSRGALRYGPVGPSSRRSSSSGMVIDDARRAYDQGPSSHWRGRFKGPVTKRERGTIYSRDGIQCLRSYAAAHPPPLNNQICDNVNWIGVSSYCVRELAGNIGCALIRRIFSTTTVIRTVFHDFDEHISTAGQYTRIVFYYRREDGTEATEIAGASPTGGFTDWFANPYTTTYRTAGLQLANSIVSQHVVGYFLYKIRITDGTTTSLSGDYCLFDVQDWIYKMYSCVSLKIQNITPADDGAVLQDTDITANPLDGVLYRFSGIAPAVTEWQGQAGAQNAQQQWGATNLEMVASDSGRILPITTPDEGWNQPVNKSLFKNCTSAMNVRLEPGDIKYTTLKFKFTGTLKNCLDGIISSVEGDIDLSNVVRASSVKFGSSLVFALKKTMRTGNATVKINYQHDVSTGCVVIPKTRRSTCMEVSLTSAVPYYFG